VGAFGQYLVIELADVMQAEMQSVAVEPLLNLRAAGAMVNGDEAADFGLVELLALLGKTRHEGLGLAGVYGRCFFHYNVVGDERRNRWRCRKRISV